MSTLPKPGQRPENIRFSSGPCTKRPGWSLEKLKNASLGRSHRAKAGKSKLKSAIELTRELLGVPDSYRIGIVPASDTGAVEMALWSLLGARGVDMVSWESFGAGWVSDVCNQLKLEGVRKINAAYGELPDLSRIDFDRDVVFTWNGTTSGVRVPSGDFIPADREGLTICDATSAAFAQQLDFDKLDVTTFSWQKVLGGEAAHGMLILSPRAVERLEGYTPPWPLPKIFRMTKGGKLIEGIFEGATINTPSMLCVEDYLDALLWAKSIGGLETLISRADANTAAVSDYVENHNWIDFLASDPATRSNTSVCLVISDPDIIALSKERQAEFAKSIASLLEAEGIALDIGAYRDAPAGFRIWCGGTVEAGDVRALMPWLGWAFETQKSTLST
ncbi:MAG: phosphoserine transaminase [Rhizobiaceae bacterium]|nr:phosphoserine transaminase [Rhizobiaceae bacterium]